MKLNNHSHNLTPDQSKKAMEIWENHMATFCGGRDSAFQLSSELILALAQPSGQAPLQIVDIACGYGGWSHFLQETYKTQKKEIEFTGMDESAHRLQVYQDILGKSAQIIQGNILDTLPKLNNCKFDTALIGWAAHEMTAAQLEQVYSLINHILKPGGFLLIADFVSGLLHEVEELSTKLIKKQRENVLSDMEKRQQEQWLSDINKHDKHSHGSRHHGEHSRHKQHYKVNEHFNFLKNAGFSLTEEVWRYMNSSVILAIK